MTGIRTLPAPARRRESRLSASQKTMVGLTIGSLILFYGVFFVFPILYAFVGSFFNWMPMKGRFDYIGLENYQKIFASATMWLSLKNTLVFTVIVTLLRTVFGLILAALIQELSRGKTLYRTLFFIPVITSTVAVSMVWKWLFEVSNGPINYVFSLVGIPQQGFLKDPNMALGCIMVMTIWKELGYAMVVYMAGITGIPRSLYESASIDGSTRWKSFRYITVPMLRSTTLLILVTSFITYCQTFTQIDLMTGGGPSKSTYTMVYLLYQEAFRNFRFGRASAIAFVLFAFIFIFSLLQIRFTQTQGGD
jgi:multiple sugar transport system permease protein